MPIIRNPSFVDTQTDNRGLKTYQCACVGKNTDLCSYLISRVCLILGKESSFQEAYNDCKSSSRPVLYQFSWLTQPLASNLWFILSTIELKTLYFKRQRDSLHKLLTLTLMPTVAAGRVTYLKYLRQTKEIRQKKTT